MKTFKLISMTDFVLDCNTIFEAKMYAKFLKQPLTLGMFIPCNEEGNPLEKPLHYFEWSTRTLGTELTEREIYANQDAKIAYKEAEEKVLFSGFKLEAQNQVRNNDLSISLDTLHFFIEGSLGIGGGDIFGNDIEALSMCNLDLKLTETARKQLGMKTFLEFAQEFVKERLGEK